MALFGRAYRFRGTIVAGFMAAAILFSPHLARRAYCQFGGCVNTASSVSDPVMDAIIQSTQPCIKDGLPTSTLLEDGDIVTMNAGPNGTIYKQTINSLIAGSTNGPFQFDMAPEGVHTFGFQVRTTATQCNIQPTLHGEFTRTVGVSMCKPAWVHGARTFHPPAGDFTILIPGSSAYDRLEDAAAVAVGRWSSFL